MVRSDTRDHISAMPLGMHTKQEILTDFNRNGYNVICFPDDTTITVSDGVDTNSIDVGAGFSIALTPDIQTVTTNVAVVIA